MAACFTADGMWSTRATPIRPHDRRLAQGHGVAVDLHIDGDGSQSVSDREHLVFVHLEGDFPGGTADLTYRFTIDGDQVAELTIAG